MSNKFFNHAIEGDSSISDVITDLMSRAKKISRELFCEIRRGMTEIDNIRQDNQTRRRQVYRHSIGRLSNLKKLQMGLYRD